MSKDIIYREDAMKEIEEYIVKENEAISEYPDDIFKYNSGLLTAIQAVHDLPSANRPQGEWIIEIDANGNTYGRCSICGMRQYAGQLNFCPDCGAKMICKYEEAEHL